MSRTIKDRKETRDYNKTVRDKRGKPKMEIYNRNKVKECIR